MDTRVFELMVKGTISEEVYKQKVGGIKNQIFVKRSNLMKTT